MKSFFSLFLLLFFSLAITAQSDSDVFMQEAAEYVCTCFEEKLAEGNASNAELAVGACLITFLEKDRERAAAALGPFDYSDLASMTRVGEKLGAKMADICPESLLKLVDEMSDEEQDGGSSEVISGTLTSVSFRSQIVEVTVQEGSGRPLKLYWLDYFPGSEILLDNPDVIGQQITVSFENIDIFSGAAKEYITRRVITEIRIE